MNQLRKLLVSVLLLLSGQYSLAGDQGVDYAHLEKLYQYLHQNPELSFQEKNTGNKIGDELEALGFKVTRNFGGYGVVAVYKNGPGPTVLIRTDLDALPIKEETGLTFASKATSVDIDGIEKPIMHACGHDIHMTVLIGTAQKLVAKRAQWQGTLVMIGQPAEERGSGAKAMLEAGLFEKFPRPDYNIALHVSAGLPSGKLAYTAGPALANVDSMDITVYGIGGHGAYPHSTKDPIVLSAQIINSLQTIVSREIFPLEPAVVTVGSIHGGHKHNIIPDEVKLQLTLRSYSLEVREQIITAIKRQVKGLALAAGLPEKLMPVVTLKNEFTPVTINNPELTYRIAKVFEQKFGTDNVIETTPVMGGEDFSRYSMTEAQIPSLIFWLGAIEPKRYQKFKQSNKPLPSLHSPFFAPAFSKSIKTGVEAMSSAAMDLLHSKQ